MTTVSPAIAAGPPLAEEPGLGPLTLPGFLREVTARHGDREALRVPGGVRWSYRDLHERSVEVARALHAAPDRPCAVVADHQPTVEARVEVRVLDSGQQAVAPRPSLGGDRLAVRLPERHPADRCRVDHQQLVDFSVSNAGWSQLGCRIARGTLFCSLASF